MNNLDPQYTALLQDILDNGVEKKDRTGTGTRSVFGRQIRHNMSDGFPLLTTKKMAWKVMVTELLWFLRGDTNIKFLVDNDCHIWDGDAWENYKRKTLEKFMDDTTIAGYAITNKEQFINKIKTDDKFAKQWGELGKIYGSQWRSWNTLKWEATNKTDPSHPDRPMLKWNIEGIDQIANLINELKTNPDSRRLMVSAWNVGELDQMILPPCHYGFQMYTRELSLEEKIQWVMKNRDIELDNLIITEEAFSDRTPKRAISLMWNQRSIDTGLGLSFNIASYGLLLMMIAKQVNMLPEDLIGSLGDCHLYLNHIEPIKEQLTRTPYKLPTVKISDRTVNDIAEYTLEDITLEDYQYHPSIKMPLSN